MEAYLSFVLILSKCRAVFLHKSNEVIQFLLIFSIFSLEVAFENIKGVLSVIIYKLMLTTDCFHFKTYRFY